MRKQIANIITSLRIIGSILMLLLVCLMATFAAIQEGYCISTLRR